MRFGEFKLSIISDGTFWLDGGSMFGVVPKILWNKLNPADEMNRIELGLNCLLVQTPEKNVLVDTGLGAKIDDKFKEMYRVDQTHNLGSSLNDLGLEPGDIDLVINTHLHFDHCGGNTFRPAGRSVPAFSSAKYVVQKKEWEDATHPNERTRASYRKENFLPIEQAGQLMLVDGDQTILPGIRVIVTNGHTQGHQSVIIESGNKKAVYLGDLIPTASHIRLPYIMGYDLYPIELLETKKKILDQAVEENWLLVFEHDPKIVFAYLAEDGERRVLKPLDIKLAGAY